MLGFDAIASLPLSSIPAQGGNVTVDGDAASLVFTGQSGTVSLSVSGDAASLVFTGQDGTVTVSGGEQPSGGWFIPGKVPDYKAIELAERIELGIVEAAPKTAKRAKKLGPAAVRFDAKPTKQQKRFAEYDERARDAITAILLGLQAQSAREQEALLAEAMALYVQQIEEQDVVFVTAMLAEI